jgi:hypothetical protein
MAPHASSVATMFPATAPEQRPVSPHLALAELAAATQPDPVRPLEVAQCSMCGITLPLDLLVPDGGQACADIRWYCQDAKSCTERWTTARPSARAHTPEVPSTAVAGAGEPAPDRNGTSADRLDGMPEHTEPAADDSVCAAPHQGLRTVKRPHDVTGPLADELARIRLELAASLALLPHNSPARVPILARMDAIDMELGRRQAVSRRP